MKTSMKRFIYFSLGPLGGALISFITIPITTYFVLPEEYGKASLFILIQTLLTAYLYFGFDQAYTREYNENRDKRNLIQNAMMVPLLIAVILSCFFLLFQKDVSLFVFHDENTIFPIFLLCMSMFTLIFERFFLLSIRMEENAKRYSLLTFMIKLFILIMTLLFILVGKRDFSVIIYGALIGQIIGDLLIIFLCRYLLNYKNFVLDKPLIRKLGIFGFPIFIAFSIEAIFNTSDRFIISFFSDYTELGLYTAAFKIASLLKIVQSSFTNFWIPTAYRWQSEGRSIASFQQVADIVTAVFAILFLLVLLCKNFILVIFTPSYAGMVAIFPFLCFVPILYTISETTTLGIVFSRKTYLNIYVSIGAVVTNIGLALLFVPDLGAKGAALSVGISYFVYYLLRTMLSNRQWEGIHMTKQLITIGILFIAGFYNTFWNTNSWIVNSVLLLSIIALHIPLINVLFFKKKEG
ncbi:oligosaccharide flippase family protein [Listeria weihenstephanensis]|uniref:Oligosaccharide flippase family protein n=1 Tax=Listeria weihenstephanensis TaxID=1006155 RepID=A0A841Z9L7_9LIST|nr:oligosaccharide flippase family protein [Listeria weihenstephanensis]MBC1501864.1 oligosaccharide flippase family protein [Listeria weihenstephanensis]